MVDVPNEEAKLNPLAERAANLRTASIDYTFEERSMSIVRRFRLKFEDAADVPNETLHH